jgi:Ca2+-binding EF-hand superfamily protein
VFNIRLSPAPAGEDRFNLPIRQEKPMNRAILSASLFTLALSASGVALSDNMSNHSDNMSSSDMFKMMDTNKDGMLSQSEANSDTKMGEKFQAMDTNKDGKISMTEYKNYMDNKHGDMGK